jgi:uncharacterized protein (TIGR03118 family)
MNPATLQGVHMNHRRAFRSWLATGAVAGLAGIVAACGGGSGSGGTLSFGGGDMPAPPSAVFAVTNLVSDGAAVPAAHTDTHLVNGWGVAFNPQGYAWVANNGTSTSTLYDGNGVAQPLVVGVPATMDADPTGIVFNGTQDFKVGSGAGAAPAAFIFTGEAGMISGWSPTVSANTSITMYDGSADSKVYKALAIGKFNNANYLYAADFHNGKVDVFNGSFALVTLAGNFVDPQLPAGYAPFGIQAIGSSIYVSYAKQQAGSDDEQGGAGLGALAVFDMGGNFVKQLVAPGGSLNAPWGIAMAPANFGVFSGALLVGNFGDGRISAFDASTGAMKGTLSKADKTPIVIDGLWGIAFGNNLFNQPSTTLFFAAGPGDESHGLYGRIDVK